MNQEELKKVIAFTTPEPTWSAVNIESLYSLVLQAAQGGFEYYPVDGPSAVCASLQKWAATEYFRLLHPRVNSVMKIPEL